MRSATLVGLQKSSSMEPGLSAQLQSGTPLSRENLLSVSSPTGATSARLEMKVACPPQAALIEQGAGEHWKSLSPSEDEALSL